MDFMDKSRGQIDAIQVQAVPVGCAASNERLGKRKTRVDEPKKKKGGECYYCDGQYYLDSECHYKADCPKRAKNRSQGLMRSSIFVKGKRVDVPFNSVGVAHATGEKKGKKMAKTKR
ncbi:hypothetical protein GN244_ATG18109 [Phytophthora infestans]|uniref:Uncharacterized protein n=1 Tax=Phytophthora infestans TaxID=4787 RepID=A0A833RPY1_PHYIN|nr:hypothetical protein GN244_ATG18109 [Phytophthora infestans]KAF4148107.1 hypothetical protein GN958_ATG02694 [Phytophthora infestans]